MQVKDYVQHSTSNSPQYNLWRRREWATGHRLQYHHTRAIGTFSLPRSCKTQFTSSYESDNPVKVIKCVHVLSGEAGLVMDVVPNDHVVCASCYWSSNGEYQTSVERSFQQLTNFSAFVIVRQQTSSPSSVILHTWIRMYVLKNTNESYMIKISTWHWQRTPHYYDEFKL